MLIHFAFMHSCHGQDKWCFVLFSSTPQNRRPDDESQISNNTQQIPSFKIFYNYVLKKMVFWEFVIRYSDYFKLCISKDDSKNNLALCLARRHCDLRLQHRSLHHVPVGNGQLRMWFQKVDNLFGNAMTEPQFVEVLVASFGKKERVAANQTLISFAVLVDIWRGQVASWNSTIRYTRQNTPAQKDSLPLPRVDSNSILQSRMRKNIPVPAPQNWAW